MGDYQQSSGSAKHAAIGDIGYTAKRQADRSNPLFSQGSIDLENVWNTETAGKGKSTETEETISLINTVGGPGSKLWVYGSIHAEIES
jgi:hypothetical protein